LTRKDVARVLDVESAMGFGWPVAEDYEVVEDPLGGGEVIRYVEGCDYTRNKPLVDGGFFLDFARSAQSPKRRSSWVRTYGLLTRKQDRLGDRLPVREFVAEAEEAQRALTLYEAVRAGDSDAIRPRISRRRIERNPESGPGKPSPFAKVFVDGREIPVFEYAEGELARKVVISIGVLALEALVNEKLDRVRFHFGENFEHPRPLSGTYTPVMGWAIPDLLTAAWFQFAMIMGDSRPLQTCPFCGELYARSRSTQETCGKDRCRKRASRLKQAQREHDRGQTESR
jgi:hypothetical protein